MTKSIDELGRLCGALLKAQPGPDGRQKVCDLLKPLLADNAFVDKAIPESTGERELLYEDPELKFCIFAEHKGGAKIGKPHDHGPSWAIYGQAAGETEMTEWELVKAPSKDGPGKVRRARIYKMTPGSAYVYNEGVLHSPSRTAPTRLIRVEGVNLDQFRALRPEYEEVP